MVVKRLAMGRVAYYWAPPTWARKRGCKMQSEALGEDYGSATRRCDELLNPQFEAWRTGSDVATRRIVRGSFDWMVAIYKDTRWYRDLAKGTQDDYDAALAIVSKHLLKDGSHFGSLDLTRITPGAADRLFEKIRDGGRGDRVRTAKLCMDVARRAWARAYREKPQNVPLANPFSKMEIEYEAKENRAATVAELKAFVAKADELGRASIGTAAMIAYYWLQREEDIFGRFAWADFRPAEDPGSVLIWHHKNRRERISVPLFDEDGTVLWPELMERLDTTPKLGPLVVMRDARDKAKKVHLPWGTAAKNPLRHVQSVVRQICEAAGLPRDISLTSFRHGGHTEQANSGLTDAQMRALGGHKSTAALLRYTKETNIQRRAGARKRLEGRRTKREDLSE